MHPYLSFIAAACLATMCLAGAVAAHDGATHTDLTRPSGPAAVYAFPLPEPGSYRLPPIRKAAGGPVLAEDGARADLAMLLRGHVTLFSFIYTRCADICPVATMQLAQLRELARQYPAVGESLRLVSMSFDPAHDTPSVMAEYGALWRDVADGGSEWLFLTTPDQATLRPLLAAYDQAVAPASDPEYGTSGLNHILRVFLIDEDGLVRNIYSMDFLDPNLVLRDIQTVLSKRITD
jgi:cytochrome oxidase Cu insertion factor (SCO1/SenC/PrrC family)